MIKKECIYYSIEYEVWTRKELMNLNKYKLAMETKLKLYQRSKKWIYIIRNNNGNKITCFTCMMIFSTLQIVWKINANETKNDRLQSEQFRSVIESSNLVLNMYVLAMRMMNDFI